MMREEIECDTCGKRKEAGLEVLGWVVTSVISKREDMSPNRFFCSGICLELYASTYVPKAPKPSDIPMTLERLSSTDMPGFSPYL